MRAAGLDSSGDVTHYATLRLFSGGRTTEVPTLLIASEDDIWAALENPEGTAKQYDNIQVDGWSPEVLYFPLEPQQYSISTTAARGLNGFSNEFKRAYAFLVYGKSDQKLIRSDEARILDINFLVRGGSAGYNIDPDGLSKIIRELLKKMSGRQVFNLLLVQGLAFLVLFFGSSAYKHWVTEQAELKRAEIDDLGRRFMSEQETKRAEIMASLVRGYPKVLRTAASPAARATSTKVPYVVHLTPADSF